ncbi:MAG: rhomboid family intramembrane serine protease [Alphaproteobacteria bacterium]|nr:rhomboid family intramembrane serine protease [Alphaproteobacteria bacterium]
MAQHEPIFNVPTVIVATVSFLVAIHLVRAVLPVDMEEWFLLAMAFIPGRLDGMAASLPGGDVATFTSFFTHMLVHGDMTHLIFNSAWMLAFGGAIALRVGGLRTLAFAICCGLAGALTFLIFNFGLMAPVIGASGAISGLMGGTMRFLFGAIDLGGLQMLRIAPQNVPLMPLRQAVADQRILIMTGIWIAINLLAIIGIGQPNASGGVAWEAHVGGYLFGLLAFGWFDVRTCENVHHQPFLH